MPKLISVGQLIDTSWELYRERFSEFIKISAWLLLLALFYTLSLILYPSASTLWFSHNLTVAENIGVILFVLTNYVFSPILGLCVLIGLVRAMKSHVSGRSVNTKKLFTEIRSLFFPTLIVSILVACLILAAVVIGFGPTIILDLIGAFFDNLIIMAIGNILLIPGVFVAAALCFIWTIEYVLAPYAAILDGERGRKALRTSRALIKGKFFATFLRLVVPKLVFLIFGVLIMAIFSYFAEIILNVAGGLSLDLRLRITTMIEWNLPVIIAVFLNPLMIIADVLLYGALKGE
ncbi:MAG: hypothetical protein AAB431_01250 [Patescibacteria group bacterium]